MSEHDETLADIAAEMRDVSKADKYTVEANPKLLSPTVLGKPICAYFAEAADRIEAAHEREKAELLKSINSYQINRVGNAAKMREALANLVDVIDRYDSGSPLWWHCGAKGVKPLKDAKAALSAPPRNCDRFKTKEEAEVEFMMSDELPRDNRDIEMRAWMCRFIDWLFAPVTKKGATDGSK